MKAAFPAIGKELELEPGTLVSIACEQAGAPLDLVCAGNGTCGKCLVDIEENGVRRTVLGCQHHIECDVRIFADSQEAAHQLLATESGGGADFQPRLIRALIPRNELSAPLGGYDFDCFEQAVSSQLGTTVEPLEYDLLGVLSSLVHESDCPYIAAIADGSRIIDLREGDDCSRLLGMAVDIGTTSVVAFLYDLENGDLLGHLSSLNGQCRYGADVISRIEHTERDAEGLALEQRAIFETIDMLVRELCASCSARPDDIYEMVLCGNSTMQHLFLGIPPSPLGRFPFVGLMAHVAEVPAERTSIAMNERGILRFMPLLGGFVGADTTACLLELPDDGHVRMMIDLGTNCEVAIGTADRMLVASTACGPALEGAGISMGMRAVDGAIEHVSFDEETGSFSISVIGDAAPIGFCGSGIIDVVATLLDIGIINRKGAFIKGAAREAHPLGARVRDSEDGRRFVLVEADEHPDGREVSVSLKDVRAIQLAKSAIYAGCTLITDTFGISPDAIEEICLAGAFGNYIDIRSAQFIGLLPSIPDVPIRSIGNGAGLGAQQYLLSRRVREQADAIRRNTTHIELANNPNFTEVYMKGMAFGSYDMGQSAAE